MLFLSEQDVKDALLGGDAYREAVDVIERVLVQHLQTAPDVVESVLASTHLEQLPAPVRAPGERRPGGHQESEHHGRVHRVRVSSITLRISLSDRG